MAATISGALKALIESLGLSLPAFRDLAPKGQSYPYASIQEGIDIGSEPTANVYSGDRGVVETAQVTLWDQLQSPNSHAQTESYTLPDALHAGLNGARLPMAPSKVYGLKVVGRVRLPNRDTGVVQHVYTVQIKRNL